jgi:hypothetical protein
MNKYYVEEILLCFTWPAAYCYAYMDDTYGNACVEYRSVWYGIFLCQLGAFRIQNLQGTQVCVSELIALFRSC